MSNVISRYFKTSAGNAFSSDSSMVSLEVNKIIVNVNTGERFKKISSNVFDKEGEEISDATTTSKGIMQVGTDLTVTDGVVSVADNFLRTNTTQDLTSTQVNRVLTNLGIEHVTGNSTYTYCRRLAIGNTQILYGMSGVLERDNTIQYGTAMFKYPFIAKPLVLATPFISTADDNATCGVVSDSFSPRSVLLGLGSPDHTSRTFYGAIGQSFPLDENSKVSSSTLSTGTTSVSLDIYKTQIKLTDTNVYFLVDMFISADADSNDYIEFEGLSGVTVQADASIVVGNKKIANTAEYISGHYTRGYDIDLSSNTSTHANVEFNGYSDKSDSKLFSDSTFSTYKMRSFIVSIPSSNISNDNTQYLRLSFNKSLSSGVSGFIRVFYIHS